jgi:hypothetical protein
MSMRRTHLGTDREAIAGLVTILTPIARRLATDKELRNELRSAADSLAGAYRRTRGDHEPRRRAGSGRAWRVGLATAAAAGAAAALLAGRKARGRA